MHQDLLIHTEAGVTTITFNRVEKKNSFTEAMYAQLTQALTAADADSATRVLVFQGDVTVFSAGNDIGDFLNNPPAGAEAPVFQFLRALVGFSKPMLAAVCASEAACCSVREERSLLPAAISEIPVCMA